MRMRFAITLALTSGVPGERVGSQVALDRAAWRGDAFGAEGGTLWLLVRRWLHDVVLFAGGLGALVFRNLGWIDLDHDGGGGELVGDVAGLGFFRGGLG